MRLHTHALLFKVKGAQLSSLSQSLRLQRHRCDLIIKILLLPLTLQGGTKQVTT